MVGNFYYDNVLVALTTLHKHPPVSQFRPNFSLTPSVDYSPIGVVGSNISNLRYPNLMSTDINLFSGVDQSYHTLMLGAMDSLGDAKQVRWLTKNNYLDTSLSDNNNVYLASKALTDFNSTNFDKSDSNLWQSSLLSGNNLDISANSPTSMGIDFQDFARNYSFFEEGREFFSGRSLWLTPQYNINRAYNYVGVDAHLVAANNYSSVLSKTQTIVFGYQKLSHLYSDFTFKNSLLSGQTRLDVGSFKLSNNAYDSGIASSNNLTPLYFTSSTPSHTPRVSTGRTGNVI